MLKANFDVGRDHIAMFEPFVRDAVATLPSEDVDRQQVSAAVLSRHGLKLPENTLRTLLTRLTRRGYLKREGGRYFRTGQALRSDDVLQSRRRAEDRQRSLAEGLIASAADRHIKVESPEHALALIMSFMEAYHVRMAFSEPPDFAGTHDEDTSSSPQHAATALFLRDVINAQGDFSRVVQEILEGYVLQNTLLLKDIADVSRRFQDTEVFLDSQILFAILGLRGPAAETATRELVELLRQTGATVSAFEPTIREMRRILVVYEDKVGTSEGRESLYPGDLTRHFLAEQFTPADVRESAALIEIDLRSSGVNLRELPERLPKWTMDEKALATALADESGRGDKPRVVHDVDCVAAVLTCRKGKSSDMIEASRAIFMTNSGMTVRQINHWYHEQGGIGCPPIIHELSLSNYAWLKRPASGAKLKVHELVALCTAALRPSRKAWERFVAHLQALERSGKISSNEAAAVVASDLTQNILAETGIDEDSDAESLSEVIERVKNQYRAEADAKVRVAKEVAEASSAEAERLRAEMKTRATTIARVLSVFSVAVIGFSLIGGTIVSLRDAITGDTPATMVWMLTFVPLGVLGLLSVVSGFHLVAVMRKAESWLGDKIEGWMLHGRFCPPESSLDGSVENAEQ